MVNGPLNKSKERLHFILKHNDSLYLSLKILEINAKEHLKFRCLVQVEPGPYAC